MGSEWNNAKNSENISKHNLSFYEAQEAFFDHNRLILFDIKHSDKERRFFCIGKIHKGGIVTVRFIIRNGQICIIGSGYWRKGKKIYEQQ